MFQAYRKKQTTTNWRQQMNRPEGKPSGTGIFKHQDARYMKWLKNELDKRETMDKLREQIGKLWGTSWEFSG